MLINGEWLENISCKKCHNRHPAEITCKESKKIADEMKLEREQNEFSIKQTEEILTDQEIFEIYADDPDILDFARAILRKAQEK